MVHVALGLFLALLMGMSWAQAQITPRVHLEALSFISHEFSNTSEKTFFLTGVSLRNTKKENFVLDFEGAYAVGKPVVSYLNIKEIYLQHQFDNLNISYGRRQWNWSGLDQAWDLGFFQPQFRWNSLDPEAQGNVGIFLDQTAAKGFSWMVFGSPLFIPDQGASFEIKEGQFQASNPWFSAPPQQVEFSGELLPIDYNLNRPKNEDVVLQNSYGAQVKWQSESGWFAKASYLSTPSHQVAVNYRAALVADRVQVDFTPQTYNEQNTAFDMGFQSQEFLAALYFLNNQVEPILHTAQENYAEIENSLAWGPRLQWNGKSFLVYAQGFARSGGEVTEKGPDAGQMSTPLTVKYLLASAYQIGVRYRWLNYWGHVEWTESTKYGLKILKIKNHLILQKAWKVFLNLFLVDTNETSSPVSNLQNLDQVTLGVEYEF